MFENKSRTELDQLGEFQLIEQLTSDFEMNENYFIKAVGDDAAVIKKNDTESILLSTDQFIENVHFDLSYFPLKHLGYKVVSSSISDILAMNAIPNGIMINLAMSNRFSLEAVEELYSGIYLACDRYGISLLGGDTSTSPKGLTISVTVTGEQKNNKIVYRNGAKETHLICVTGEIGAAYCGLQVLEREKQVFLANPKMQPDLDTYNYIVGKQLKPEAQTNLIKKFDELGIIPSAMIDVSDGLTSDLMHIAKQSNVGVILYETKIPMDPQTINLCEEFNFEPLTIALSGGEDYELLFTVPQSEFEKLRDIEEVSVIGYCTAPEEGLYVITKNDNKFKLQAQGWK